MAQASSSVMQRQFTFTEFCPWGSWDTLPGQMFFSAHLAAVTDLCTVTMEAEGFHGNDAAA